MNTNEYIEFMLMMTGACTILFVLVMVSNQIRKVIGELIDNLRWKYKHKHRFDKPPTAKCYCKDCVYYLKNPQFKCKQGHINGVWNMMENDFCSYAKPYNHDPENN